MALDAQYVCDVRTVFDPLEYSVRTFRNRTGCSDRITECLVCLEISNLFSPNEMKTYTL